MNLRDLLRARIAIACLIAVLCVPGSALAADSKFDGSWDLAFVTRSGHCDPSYNFSVNILQGHISHPNLVRFTGNVAKSGATRASVRVGEKFALGAGRLSQSSGGGSWRGYSGSEKCSGTWTAQRNF